MASFPSAIKTFTTRVASGFIFASIANEIQAEITAIETWLGVNGGSIKATSADLDTGTNDAKFATSLAIAGRSEAGGWTPTRQTWTYASATTINVPTDATILYSVGDKIRFKQGGAYKYFYICTVAATLLTVTGGSDYTVANATITDVYYSKASSPVGFPQYFNYAPTGISATNVTHTGRFCIVGRRCLVDYIAVFSGGITFTTMPTLPVPVSASMVVYATISFAAVGNAGYYDAGVAYYPMGLAVGVNASGTTFVLVTAAGTTISATTPITWANVDCIDAHFSYPI
jgi:hypothetical protein